MVQVTQCPTPTPAPAYAHASAREEKPLPVWYGGFLAALAITSNVSQAARAVGITRRHAHRVRQRDAAFAEQWAEALATATDALLLEARRLALGHYVSFKFTSDGRPLIHPETGEPYSERVVHDGLLLALLKAYRPELFGNRLALGVAPPAPAYDLSKLTNEELAQLEALTRKMSVLAPTDG